jgi:hypothetical protein
MLFPGQACAASVPHHNQVLPMMMLPTPWLEASTTPTKFGQPVTSSRHHVGQLVDSRSIVRQLDIANQRGSF